MGASEPGSNSTVHDGPFASAELRTLLQRSLNLRSLPAELLPVLQQQPEASADVLAECFERCERLDERERLVELTSGLGLLGLEQLKRRLFKGSPEEAVRSVGLLARLAHEFLDQHLLPRLTRWEHARQDAAVKTIGFSGSRHRARLLQNLAEHVHPYVLPVVIDEIGSAGEAYSAPWLMRLAAGEALQAADLYVRVKAIEALGRIGSPLAVPLLTRLVEAKQVWRWEHPRELRICALQSIAKIEPAHAKQLAASARLPERELALMPMDPQPNTLASGRVRQRRYSRVQLSEPLPLSFTWLHGTSRMLAEVLSLAGGFARPVETPGRTATPLSPLKVPRGTTAEIEFHTLLRRIHATAVVRNTVPHGIGFEMVVLDLDARTRLRQLLAAQPALAA